jgi:hypothetical protein
MEFTVTINAPALADALNNVAAALSGKTAGRVYETAVNAPVVAPVAAPVAAPAPAPVAAPAPAVDEAYRARVCTAAAKLIDAGKMAEVLAALHSQGVQAVTQLTAEQLPVFAEVIKTLGAVI